MTETSPLSSLRRAAPPPGVPANAALRTDLVERWFARVHGVALALTGRAHDAEDLVQEAFLRALRADTLPRSPAARGPWLVSIARHAWIDRQRRLRRERPLPEPTSLPAPEDQPVPTDPVERGGRSLMRLPEDERLVCWLRVVADLPFREIAVLLGTSKSGVDRTFRRGLARLREESLHDDV